MHLWSRASETLLDTEGSLDSKRSLLPRGETKKAGLIFAIVAGLLGQYCVGAEPPRVKAFLVWSMFPAIYGRQCGPADNCTPWG